MTQGVSGRIVPMTLAPIPAPGGKPKKKRKSPRLTPEQRAALAERARKLHTNPEINAKRAAGIKRCWQDPEYRARHLAILKQFETKRKARNRLVNAEKAVDPEWKEANRKRILALWASGKMYEAQKTRSYSPEGYARLIASIKRAQDKRRGFKVPPLVKSRYLHLIRSKRLSAKEAGRIMGLI